MFTIVIKELAVTVGGPQCPKGTAIDGNQFVSLVKAIVKNILSETDTEHTETQEGEEITEERQNPEPPQAH